MGVTDLALVRRSWALSRRIPGVAEKGGDPNGQFSSGSRKIIV